MRRTEPIRIGDLWSDFLSKAPVFALRLAEAKLPKLWPQAAGNRVAMYTTKIEIKRGVLTAYISSSAARNELFMNRTACRDRLNELLGTKVVNNVIVK